MPMSNIYNEGRVVGYSAYEIYVRHSLSENSDRTPATELEWLSSTIAMGSSMLLKVSTDNTSGFHYRDFQFPSNTNLAAANTIIGSFFLGEADCDETGWAQKVTSYGPLLSNNSEESPTIGDHTHSDNEKPLSLTDQLTDEQKDQLDSYMKVVDGLIIQPGEWEATSDTPPKDLKPNLGDYPRVRIYFSDKVEEAFYVLLTGFTLGTVLDGVSGLDGSTDPTVTHPQNGAFLGPGVFPWANKIIFSVPNSYIDAWIKNKYSRKLIKDNVTPADYTEVKVQTLTDIDEESLTDYYGDTTGLAFTIPVDAENAKANNPMNILTVYQRYSVLPPALYASVVDETGESDSTLYPVDVVSPGTVKMYKDDDLEDDPLKTKYEKILDKINALESKAHKNVGLVKSEDSIVWEKSVSTNAAVPVSKTEYDADDSEINDSGVVKSQTGDNVTYALSMGNENGKYATDGSHDDVIPASGKITWDELITILKDNDSLDLLKSDRFYEMLKYRLSSGPGISITEGQDPNDQHNQLIIGANLAEGTGIELTTDPQTGAIYITNTMPDYSNGNYTRVLDSQYTLNSVNRFDITKSSMTIEYCASTDKKTIAIRVSFGGDTYAKMTDFGSRCTIHEWKNYNSQDQTFGPWQGELLKSGSPHTKYDSHGIGPANTDEYHESTFTGNEDTAPWPLTINGSGDEPYWSVFAFRHDLHSELSNKKANIINISFSQSLIDTLFIHGTDGHGDRSKYRFEDTTGATSGIWNVGLGHLPSMPSGTTWAGRGSWSATCHLRANQEHYSHRSDSYSKTYFRNENCDLAVFGFGYADGYNSQFPASYNCNWLGSDLLNLEVGGVFRYVG